MLFYQRHARDSWLTYPSPQSLSAFSLNSADMAQEKQQYLQQVKHFCTQVKNDWYRVYLVRRLTSQCGLEFVQSLSRQGHPAQWVFPPEVLALQVRSAHLASTGAAAPPPAPHPHPRVGTAAPLAPLPAHLPHPPRKRLCLVCCSVSALQSLPSSTWERCVRASVRHPPAQLV